MSAALIDPLLHEEWFLYEYRRPDPDALCVFVTCTGQRFVGRRIDLHPEFNIAGLRWKLTGIERESQVREAK